MAVPSLHVALLPSAGMGHLTPHLRLAAFLVHHHHHQVTLITPFPTVSLAESKLLSRFLSAFPQVNHFHFNLLPLDPSTVNATDPFLLRSEAIRRSAHLLPPLLASVSPPLSALILDVFLISPMIPVVETLSLPSYILFTSSARMLSFFSFFTNQVSSNSAPIVGACDEFIEIPGIPSIPRSSIPPPLLVPDSLFATLFREDGRMVLRTNGVLINTFEGFETESLKVLNGGKAFSGLPPVFAVGPFVPYDFEKEEEGVEILKWLNDQPTGSVVYVCFGSRTAMKQDQVREIGDGLVRSGCRFLWVVKDKIVDRDEDQRLEDVVGHELMEGMKKKGLVVKKWVNQREILEHRAVGGFVSHCGWNSVIEAAWNGVPILGWPLHGDQKINAEVVEASGLGVWEKNWGWEGETLVKAEEIGKVIKEMMGNESLKMRAGQVKEAARKAVGNSGSTEIGFKGLTEEWKKRNGKSF